MENNFGCPACRKKERSEGERRALRNRLLRIEGQIRGIIGMIDNDAYCIDIINQASAAASAISAFERALISSHIRSCVKDDIREGNDEKLDELLISLSKLLK